MRRSALRTCCALFVSILFISALLLAFSKVNAQPRIVVSAPEGVTQALSVYVPLATNRTTLAGSVSVKAVLDSARAVTKTIPPSGGVIVATGADGDRYTLTLPDGALLVTTTVTLTPVQSLGALPSGAFVAGVQIAPDMHGLWRAATLRIEPAPAVAVADQFSFAWFDGGKDFHLYPLALDHTRVEYSITRLHGYGVGTTAAARAFDQGSLDQTPGPVWTPNDILAQISQRMQPILQQMRADADADRPPDESLIDELVALLKEAWEQAIAPLLPQMRVDCEALVRFSPIVEGWYKETVLFDEGTFDTEYAEIDSTAEAGLRKCIDEAAEPCVLRADILQVDLIHGYMRELLLRGAPVDFTLDELPQCQEIVVTMGGDLSKQFAMQPDPESGWHTKALYTFSDGSAAGVLTVNPFGMFGTGARGKVTLTARIGDVWFPVSMAENRWLCRDKLADRIDAMIVRIEDVTYTGAGVSAPPVPFYLQVSKMGCWRWSIEQSYSDEYTGDADVEHTREWTIETTLEVSGTEPFAAWDALNSRVLIYAIPLKFQVMSQGAFDYEQVYAISGEHVSCRSTLTSHEAPPAERDPRFSGFTVNIDKSLQRILSGYLEIVVTAEWQGSCSVGPVRFVGFAARGEVDASGRSSSGSDNGFLGEQSGVWEATWSYQALRE